MFMECAFSRISYNFCRQVSIEEGDAKAREFSVMFIETSAKAGFNIKVCFPALQATLTF